MIESHEHEDALLEIAELCREEEWQLLNWDIDAGLQTTSESGAEAGNDPLAAIRAAAQTGDNTTLLVLRNFHRFMQSPEVIQALANQVALGKQQRTFFVVLSPVVQIPIELEKLFVVIKHQQKASFSRPARSSLIRGIPNSKQSRRFGVGPRRTGEASRCRFRSQVCGDSAR